MPPPGSYPAGYEPGGEPVLVSLGDISVTQTHVILPHGRYPLRGTTWHVQDQMYATQKISQLGVVLAVVGFVFICAFSLLFLLMKETVYHGSVDVTVTGPNGLHHTVRFPAAGPHVSNWVHGQVSHIRGLAAAA
jgi:hypothetical protein